MHKFLMEARHFFRGQESFVVTAENKSDAISKGAEYIHSNGSDNYAVDSIRCIKKLKS